MGVGFCAGVVPGCMAKGIAKTMRKPNILVIISDDAGYIDFGCFGGKQFPTPNIDRFARRAVRCTNGYVTASVCGPSRAGLMTGRYQQRFGHEFNGPSSPTPGFTKEDMGLDTQEKTIAQHIKPLGYKTMALGKWHLGSLEKYHPLQRGFDEFYGFLGGSRSYFPLEKKQQNVNAAMRRGDEKIDEVAEIKYLTDDLTAAAIDFIDRNKQEPFFMYLAYNAVHAPMHGKEEIIDQFGEISPKGRRIYAAMTTSLDIGVGKVMDCLAKNKIDKDTLIIFINDNGGATVNSSDNGPLRGMKGSKWEGGIRVPYMLSWKGQLPEGVTYDKPVSSLDILPTAIAAAGGKAEAKLDGVNLLPYLTGDKKGQPHEILFWRRGVAAAVRQGKWKLIRVKSNPDLLFDLEKDLGETTNIAGKYPQKVKELLAELTNWEKDFPLPKWTEGKYWEDNQIRKHQMDVIGRDMERKYP
ncbi:MAG: sulfatase-like hydrolase/transferase [Phycisphaerae bacterium]|nr:sulfatase-like hydrolase/transferase [Phycisphaerae bacterium]